MNSITKGLTVLVLGLSSSIALATPSYLITHNKTDVESNAYINNIIPSVHPTKAYSDGKVSWMVVKVACFGSTSNGKCPAMIKMKTDTSSPIDLGMVSLDLNTGDITPKTLTANGYTFTANGPGEGTLTKN